MATFDYGLNLELKNFQTFVSNAQQIDDKLKSLSSVIDSSAVALGKIDTASVAAKGKALNAIAVAYTKLGTAIATVNANAIVEVNKALSGGAQVKTIEGKAEAMAAFVKEAQKLSKLPDMGPQTKQIIDLLAAFSKISGSLGNFQDFGQIATNIGLLIKSFEKLGKSNIDPKLTQNLDELVKTFGAFSGPTVSAAIATMPVLTDSLDKLFKSIRTLSTGKAASELPAILAAVSNTISSLLTQLNQLNKNPLGGANQIIDQITKVGAAFRDLGVAVRSYGGKNVTGFDNIEENISKTLRAFQTLIAAFKNQKIGDDIANSVVPAATAVRSLGEAFESLGRKKGFEKFPETVNLINTAINNLNIAGLNQLAARIQAAIPALRDLAEVAKAVSIVNSQAGKSFVQVARDKDVDSSATQNLIGTYYKLSSAIASVIPVIGSVVNIFISISRTIANLIPFILSLGNTMLRLPFNVVVSGFKFLATAIASPFNLLIELGKLIVKSAHDFHLMRIGIEAIILPFKLLFSAISAIISVIASVSSGVSKFISSITGFGKATQVATTEISDFVQVENTAIAKTQDLATAVQTSGDKVSKSGNFFSTLSNKIIGAFSAFDRGGQSSAKYSEAVDKVGKSTTQASHSVQTFSNSIGDSSGRVEEAVNKLGALQVRIASVQKVAALAEELFKGLKDNLVSTAESAFDAAAKFEKLQISLSILSAREFVKANPGQFDTVLDAMGAVKESVDATIERFEMLAITSPFTSQDIASGYQLAQVYGFTSKEAESLTNILVDANAAIGESGANISSIVLPLGQIKQLGKATLVDLKQVATAAKLPVFEVLQQAMEDATNAAVPMSDVMDAISNGMISADFAINAITNSLKTDFQGAAAASTNTFEGLRSTLSDLRENTLRKFATPIFKAILFGENEGDFALAGLLSLDRIKEQLANAQKSGEEFASKINTVFQAVVKVIQYVSAAFALIPQPIITAAKAVATFIASTTAATIAILAIGLGLFELVVVIGSFVSVQILAVAAVVGLASTIIANYGAIKEAVLSVGESFTQLPGFITASITAIQTLITTGSNVGNPFSEFTGILQTFGAAVLSSVNYAIQFSRAFGEAFSTLVSTGKTSIEVFSGLPAVLQIVGSEIIKVLGTFATWGDAIATFPITISGVASTISESFSSMLGSFVEWGSNIIIAFSEGINNTINLLSQAIGAIGDVLTFWLAPGSPPRVAPELDKWGELAALEFVNSFVSGFGTAFNQASSLISENFSGVMGTIGQAILTPFAKIGEVAVILIGGTIANALAAIVTIGSGVIEIIAAISQGIGNQIGIILVTFIKIVEALAKPTKAFETLKNVVQAMADGAKASLQNFGNTLNGVFSGILSIFGGVIAFINGEFLVGFIALSRVSQTISDSLTDLGNGSRDFLGGVIQALRGAENAFANTMQNVVDYGSNIVQQFANGMLDAVSLVAQALQEIGSMITYWLAPGSPPKLLPDIDQWGTDAATEFLQGFSEADFNNISDFGKTVTQLLTNLDVQGIDTKDIVETFAAGLSNINETGDFGQGNLDKIQFLAQSAGVEVAVLAEKYAALAKEQKELNSLTAEYDKQLQSAQGTLDNITTQEDVSTNDKKVAQLQNALNNSLLTQEERTRIQTQIDKIQAQSKVKQLEQQKKAQEGATKTAEEALNLQKEQLNLAQEFDSKGGLTALGTSADKNSSSLDKATKAQDKLNDAVLKYKLQTADTAGKIAILREELKKTKEGSVEYYEILTEISQLEKQLANEREKSSKVGVKEGLLNKFGDTLAGGAGLTGLSEAQTKVQETIDNAKGKIDELQKTVADKFGKIRDAVSNAWTTIRGYLDAWVLKNDTVKASIVAIGIVIGGVKLISGISAIGSALALLSNPLIAISAGVLAITAAFGFFAVKSGGIQGAIDSIREKFTLLKDSFSVGAASGVGTAFDFSSIDTALMSIGTNIGAASANVVVAFQNFFLNLGTNISAFVANLSLSISTGWANFQTNLIALLSNLNILNTQIGTIATNVVNAIFTYFITPISLAFGDSETLLGGLTNAFIAFYDGVVQLVSDVTLKIQSFLSSQNNGKMIEDFFSKTFIGQNLEANINEAVGNIIPSLEGSFDLSEFVISVVNQMKALYNGIIEQATQIQQAFQPLLNAFFFVRDSLSSEDGGGILGNIISQNAAAFGEFITEVTSPEFISGLTNIGKLLGIVAGALAAVAAAIIDVALIAILKNLGDIVIEVGAGVGTLFEAFDLFMAGDIIGGFGKAFEGVQQILEGVFGNISDIIADAIKTLLEFFGIDTSGPLGTIIQFVSDIVVSFFAFNKIVKLAGLAWSGLVSVFNYGKSIFAGLIALFASSSIKTSLLTKAFNLLKTALLVPTQLIQKFPTLVTTIIHAFLNLPDEVSKAFTKIKNDIIGSFTAWLASNPLFQSGVQAVISFFLGFMQNIGPGTLAAATSIISGLGLIDLSSIAAGIGKTLNFNTSEIIAGLQENFTATLNAAVSGITDIGFNIADAIFVSEEDKEALADKIKGFLPDFDALFGKGATDKAALNIADFITIDTEEVNNIKENLLGVVTTLEKFVKILPLPESFSLGLETIKGVLTGDIGLNVLASNLVSHLNAIITAVSKAFANPFVAINDAIVNLQTPITAVSEGFVTIKDSILGLLDINLTGFAALFAPITDTFAGIQSNIDGLVSGIQSLNIIPGINIGGSEVSGGDAVREKIKSTLSNNTLDVKQKLDIITDDENLSTQSKKLLDAFKASYETNSGAFATDFSAINADLIEQGFTAADIATLAEKFGKEVPAGLAEGMADTDGTLDRATRGLATSLLDSIASELGIQSPSTEARDEIGVPFVLGIVEGLSDYTTVTAKVAEIATAMLTTVSDTLSQVSNTINIAASLFQLNEASVQLTNQSLSQILNLHTVTFDTIAEDTIPSFVDSFFSSMEEMFENTLDLTEEFATEFVNIIKGMVASTLTILSELQGNILKLIGKFKETGEKLGRALTEGIVKGIEDTITAVIGAVGTIFGKDGVDNDTVLKNISDVGKKLGKAFTEGIASGMVMPAALAAIKVAVEKIISEAEAQAKKAAGVKSPSTLFRDAVGVFITEGIGEGMLKGLDSLIDVTTSVIDTVYNLASNNIGSMFTQGVSDGIQSQQTVLFNTITALLTNSVVAAKAALDINSPSEVTRTGIGVPYVQGIMNALEAGKGDLASLAGNLLSTLPTSKKFEFSIGGQVKKQPIEMMYANLITSLPLLNQRVSLTRSGDVGLGNIAALQKVSTLVQPYGMMDNGTAQTISTMQDARRTFVTNNNVYNYTMHVQTTPDRAERVRHNFDAMRTAKRI